MGISTSPKRLWVLVNSFLILFGSIGIRFTIPDPMPWLGIPALALLVVGLVVAAALFLGALGPEGLAWTRPMGMAASVVGLVIAILVAPLAHPPPLGQCS